MSLAYSSAFLKFSVCLREHKITNHSTAFYRARGAALDRVAREHHANLTIYKRVHIDATISY